MGVTAGCMWLVGPGHEVPDCQMSGSAWANAGSLVSGFRVRKNLRPLPDHWWAELELGPLIGWAVSRGVS